MTKKSAVCVNLVEERIYWLYKPIGNHLIGEELKPKHALLTSIWRFPPEQNNTHPAPFPIELPTRAIYSVMDDKKGLVIDPYCGSGTTLVAAKMMGHNFLGIEIANEYIDTAKERLTCYENERKAVNAELGKHVVAKTFAERKRKGEFTGKHRTKKNLGNNFPVAPQLF